MNTEDFRTTLINSVEVRAAQDGLYSSEAFIAEVAERLADAEEIEHLETLSFDDRGSKGRRLRVNGFDLDDSDGSIALAVLDFDGGPGTPTISSTEAEKLLQSVRYFLEASLDGSFFEGREESTLAYQLATDLRNRGRNVTRYRFYLVSDRSLTGRKTLQTEPLGTIPTETHIWDITRLHQVAESAQGREALELDLTEWMPNGLDTLRVSDSSQEFDTYLAAVPGAVVADLYQRHGSRLLEGNVRSYLSNRGKVNKGIRETVATKPERFLAFNNGISATATGVDLKNGRIVRITDLQIVNGGQTTASLFYVRRDARDPAQKALTDVYVQMKLVVVQPEEATEMIPLISRYANSQNKVSEADFFSNSPFHVRLADLSQRVLAPPKPGVNFQTKWFYERTRGSYQNEKNKRSVSDQKKFDAEFPRNQVITKTDAAKYEVTWHMQPHVVSGGAQKNFLAFANLVGEEFSKSDASFNELYWKELVAKAILFNAVRKAIAAADWYDRGYLANLTTYSIAKFAYEVGRQHKGASFDLGRIWAKQEVPKEVLTECVAIGERVLAVLNDPNRPVLNVTEWAKNRKCWERVRELHYEFSSNFTSALADRSEIAKRKTEAAATQKVDNGIAAQAAVVQMPPEEWRDIENFAKVNRLLTDKEAGILMYVTGRKVGFPSERQSAVLLELLERCKSRGYVSV